MKTAEYIRQETQNNERSFDVYRPDNNRSYDGTRTDGGEVPVWLFDASATSSMVTEGADEETSLTGFLRPSADLADPLSVGDELRLVDDDTKRYEVRTKVGVPTELDPVMWQLGIDRANEA